MLFFLRRIFIIISLSTFFLTYCLIYPSGAAPDYRERLILHQAISGLQSDADVLAQELLALDLKLKKAEQKSELLKKELAITGKKRNEALIQYNKALEAKQHTLAKIRPWINFQYRCGYWSLIDSLLGASSLSDLMDRTMLVSLMLGRQVKDYRAAENAREVSLLKEQALKEAIDQLARQDSELEGQIEEIKIVTGLRKDYLDGIKSNSSELAQKVMVIEARLLYSLELYSFLTGALAKIPWENIKPDRIDIGLGGITLEMSENSLNQSIHSSGDGDLNRLSVDLQKGVFSLLGKDNKSPSTFLLSGSLTPDGSAGAVRLNLQSFSLDGIPVSGKALEELAGNSILQMPLPEDMRPFKVSSMDITEDNFIVKLKR
ncbi:MAG: hypothetical protein JL50_04650 [Peptococcaceae bacterium BICA1-7]|nr:MAG: hypothetical protein JL50_04650 [Peptococcaceae bacterium BICA1-7]HBV95912.1 hypothetical protein [Desulfotomaculum sp.]